MEKNLKFKEDPHIKAINPFLTWDMLDSQKPFKLLGEYNRQMIIPLGTKIYSYFTINISQYQNFTRVVPNFMRQMDWILATDRYTKHVLLATEVQVIKKPKRMLLFLEKDERATNI